MDIILAEHCGFCYGVKRAVSMVQDCIGKKSEVKTLGPIIHNPQFVEELKNKGIGVADNLDDVTAGAIIIRSHGVGPETYRIAEEKQLEIVDATCPHVKKAQQAAQQLLNEGYKVVVIGEKIHPEVKSIVQWSSNQAVVIETLEEAKQLPFTAKMGVVAQTTFSGELFTAIVDILQDKCDALEVCRTICTATDTRQQAAVELANKADIMIVVGGKNSANTTRLADLCRQAGCKVRHIETWKELSISDFKGMGTAGITAGASTPDWIIEEVYKKMQEFNQILEQDLKKIETGMIVQGKVVGIRKDEVFVDIGYKGEGSISLPELAYPVPETAHSIVSLDQVIDVYVMDADSADGIKLSKVKADKVVAWDKLEEALTDKQPVEGQVIEVVKGGLRVSVFGVAGFIPASHIDLKFVEDLASFQNQTLSLIPIEVDREKQKIVLSRKILLQAQRRQKEDAVFATLKTGQLLTGTVKRVVDFGAFVDIGDGVEGLVHVSDLAWNKIQSPLDVVKVDDKVSVIVLNFDQNTRRISLGLKQVEEDPWFSKVDNIKVEMNIKGKVSKIAKFGAFVDIGNGIEGLIHVSELSDKRISDPHDVISSGQEVTVKVLDVDKKNKRIALSLIKAQEDAERAEYQGYLHEQENFSNTIGDKLGALLKGKF